MTKGRPVGDLDRSLPARRRAMAKLKALDKALADAQTRYLLGIADAYRTGMPYREIAQSLKNISESSVGKYVAAGEQLRSRIAEGGSVTDFAPGTAGRDAGMGRRVSRKIRAAAEE